jgi:hypothetical protein
MLQRFTISDIEYYKDTGYHINLFKINHVEPESVVSFSHKFYVNNDSLSLGGIHLDSLFSKALLDGSWSP